MRSAREAWTGFGLKNKKGNAHKNSLLSARYSPQEALHWLPWENPHALPYLTSRFPGQTQWLIAKDSENSTELSHVFVNLSLCLTL